MIAISCAGHCVDLCRLHLDVTLMYIGLGSLQTIGICVCVWVSLLTCACLVHPCFLVGADMFMKSVLMACSVKMNNSVLVLRCGEDYALHVLQWQ